MIQILVVEDDQKLNPMGHPIEPIEARYFHPGRLMSFLGRLVQSAAYLLKMLL